MEAVLALEIMYKLIMIDLTVYVGKVIKCTFLTVINIVFQYM